MKMDESGPLTDRFFRYVKIDTQSDPSSLSQPSTEKQKNLGRLLVAELLEAGIADAELDAHGYVYATIPSTSKKNIPAICFCAHMDTAPDCSGNGVKPLLHLNYNGGPIVLPDDPAQVIRPEEHPYLLDKKGEDIITASGTTLLGADDKAGVAIIMELALFLQRNPAIKHGPVRILFTPDEEIGRGVDMADLKKLNAVAAYTLDGGERGSLEEENFSADGMKVIFHGVTAHPGDAKGKLVNALKVAGAFLDSLPKGEKSPETTSDRQGFVHPVRMEGTAEKATIEFIIRDFETARLKDYESMLENLSAAAVKNYPGATAETLVREQYRNMKRVLEKHPEVSLYAREAMRRSGITVRELSIRGGTDGARLSFMGLPCPNLFTGEMALHGKHEFVSVQDMMHSINMLVQLCMIWEEKTVILSAGN